MTLCKLSFVFDAAEVVFLVWWNPYCNASPALFELCQYRDVMLLFWLIFTTCMLLCSVCYLSTDGYQLAWGDSQARSTLRDFGTRKGTSLEATVKICAVCYRLVSHYCRPGKQGCNLWCDVTMQWVASLVYVLLETEVQKVMELLEPFCGLLSGITRVS